MGEAGYPQLPQTETQQRKLWEQKPQASQPAGNVDKAFILLLRLGKNFPGKEKRTQISDHMHSES